MLRSIPLIVIGLIAFFSVPSMFDGMMRLISYFSIKSYLRIRLHYDEHCHGIRSWGNGLNDRERTTLSSARGMGSTVGGLISSMITCR